MKQHQLVLHFDLACPDDTDVYHAQLSEKAAKSVFMLGWTLYRHNVNDVVERIVHENIHSELSLRYERIISDLKDENISLAKVVSSREEVHDAQHVLELEKKDMKIQQLQEMLHQAEIKLKNVYDDMYSDGVQQLKDMIKERDVQIQLLRSTNAAKGVIGENMILEALRNMYDDAIVEHTGKTAHACDVKLVFRNGTSILFESKYKGSIQKSDITKFEYDIESSSDEVKSGMFVSIMSKNIPGKGQFYIELLAKNTKPVMYVAYGDETEFNMYFKHHCKMLQSLVLLHSQTSCFIDANNMTSQVIESCKYFHEMSKRNKKRLDDLKCKFTKYVEDVECESKSYIQHVDALVALVSKTHTVSPSCSPVSPSQTYTCSKCSRKYKSAKTFANHKCVQEP